MSSDEQSGVRSDVRSLLEITAAIAGSGALLTALMLYFGWVRTRVLFDYFGVPVSILDYSTTDYVLRSAEVFFKPAVWSILAVAVLAAISAGAHRVERAESARLLRPIVRGVLAMATLGGVVAGMLGLMGRLSPGLSSVLLCGSGALIVLQYLLYRAHAGNQPRLVVLAVGVMLTLAAAFWAVSIFAANIGIRAVDDIGAGRQHLPRAVVYSTTDLGIAGQQGPHCQMLADGKTCRFTYSGYRLLAYTNHRWFLIREPWAWGLPTVILGDNDSVRVELAF